MTHAWTFRKLSDISSVTLVRGMPSSRVTAQGEVPVKSVAMLRSGEEAQRFAGTSDLARVGATIAEPGDVLIAVEGGTAGECLVVQAEMGRFVPSQQAATLRVLPNDELDPWFLAAWLTSEEGQRRVDMLKRGSAIQRIALSDLEYLEVPLPPIAEQRKVGERFRAFADSIGVHRKALGLLESLLKADLALEFAVTEEAPRTHKRIGEIEPRARRLRPTGSPARGGVIQDIKPKARMSKQAWLKQQKNKHDDERVVGDFDPEAGKDPTGRIKEKPGE